MNPIHASLAEYQTQTDLDVLCEQSVESKGGGEEVLSTNQRGRSWALQWPSDYYPTLPQTLRGVKGWVRINPSFNDGKFTFSLFT